MKQVLIRGGEAYVDEVPAPALAPGMVLVRVLNSCISSGTEGARVGGAASKSLMRRALEDPDKIKRALEMALERGIKSTMAAVRGTVSSGSATGYSVAGVVERLGAGVTDLAIGDRVACAGAGLANHAEYVAVPRNLTVRIPAAVDFEEASTVTLGAIAMQGVRRLEPTLGELFVVVGLGLLGQLTVQILQANGCRVIGVDPNRERVDLARSLGMDGSIPVGAEDASERVARMTDGYGADGVVITAASDSDEIISQAFRMCRPKGRVVVVGDVGLNIQRADIYRKELEFRISTSYGPGRYDLKYEEAGLDYPIGYVRWTENRNMQEYLKLIADGKVRVRPLVREVYTIDRATAAFETVGIAAAAPLVLLSYPAAADAVVRGARCGVAVHAKPAHDGKIGIAVIGAGAFTRNVHLPNLQELSGQFDVRAIVNRTGTSAKQVADRFGAAYATTDYQEVMNDPDVDAVVIGTRHHLHAEITLAALHAGKHVLVEKPLAITPAQLSEIEAYFAAAEEAGRPIPVLMTGYNRRFSPYAERLKPFLIERANPAMLVYRMNAGYLPVDHWVHGAEGGGRNIGEGCHIYDLFAYLLDAPVVDVQASAISPPGAHYGRSDNFVATLSFEDGSVATLVYTALGHKEIGKERLEVFTDGAVAILDDYKALTFAGKDLPPLRTSGSEKGHGAELEAFGRAIREDGAWPIPLWEQIQTARVSFEVERIWDSGMAVEPLEPLAMREV